MRIGLISDTHGLLRLEACAALAGVDLILHMGDLGHVDVLHGLEAIAPVHAIRGNIDQNGPCALLPETLALDLAGQRIYMLHSIADLKPDVVADIVLYGHSHKPALEMRGDTLLVNPGAAGKRRFSLPISVAILELGAGRPEVHFINLLDDRPLP